MMILFPGVFSRRAAVAALGAAALALTSGCGTQAPCLTYQPMMMTKHVSMRGYGTVRVTSEEMVCTERAEIIESVAATD
jgi:hypothetical protein